MDAEKSKLAQEQGYGATASAEATAVQVPDEESVAPASNPAETEYEEANENSTLLPPGEVTPTMARAKRVFRPFSLVYTCLGITVVLFVFMVILLSVIYAVILPKRLQEDYTDSAEPRFFYFDIHNITDTGAVVSFNGSIDTYGDLHVRFKKNIHILETMAPLEGFDDTPNSSVYLQNWRPRTILTVGMPDIVTSPTEYIPLNISNSPAVIGIGEDREWLVKFIQEGVLGGKLKSRDLTFRLWSKVETVIEEPWYKFGGFHWNDLEVEDFLDIDLSALGGSSSDAMKTAASPLDLLASFNISLDYANSRLALVPSIGTGGLGVGLTEGEIRLSLTNPTNLGLHLGALSLDIGVGSNKIVTIEIPALDLNARNLKPQSNFQILLKPAADSNVLPLLSKPVNVSNIHVDYPQRKANGTWIDAVLDGLAINANLPISLPGGGDIDLGAILGKVNDIIEKVNIIGLTDLDLDITALDLSLLPATRVAIPVSVYNPTLLGLELGTASVVVSVNSKNLLKLALDPLDLAPEAGLSTELSLATLPQVNPLALLDLLNGRNQNESLVFSLHDITVGTNPAINKLLSGFALNATLSADNKLNLDYTLGLAIDEILAIVTPNVVLSTLYIDVVGLGLNVNAELQINNPTEYALFIGNVTLTVAIDEVELPVVVTDLNLAPNTLNTIKIVLPDIQLLSLLPLLSTIGSAPEIPVTIKGLTIANEASNPDTYTRINALLSALNIKVAIPAVSTGNLDIFALLGKVSAALNKINVLGVTADLDITGLKRIGILPILDVSLPVGFINPTEVGFALLDSSVIIGVNRSDVFKISFLPLNLLPSTETQTVLNLQSVPGFPLTKLLSLISGSEGEDLVVSVHNITLGTSAKLNAVLANVSLDVTIPKDGGVNVNYTLGVALTDIANVIIPLVEFEDVYILPTEDPIVAGADIIYTSTTDYGIYVGNISLNLGFNGSDLFNVRLDNFDLRPQTTSTVLVRAEAMPGVTLDALSPLLELFSDGKPIPLTISSIGVHNDLPNDRLNAVLGALNLNVVIPPINLGGLTDAQMLARFPSPALPIEIEPFGSLVAKGLIGFVHRILAELANPMHTM